MAVPEKRALVARVSPMMRHACDRLAGPRLTDEAEQLRPGSRTKLTSSTAATTPSSVSEADTASPRTSRR